MERLSEIKILVNDKSTIGMSATETGIYYRMQRACAHYGSLPSNIESIAKIINCVDDAKSIISVLNRGIFERDKKDKAVIIHPDIEAQRTRLTRWKDKCSSAGKKSAAQKETRKQNSAAPPSAAMLVGIEPTNEKPPEQKKPKLPRAKVITSEYTPIVVALIEHLNTCAGHSYKTDTPIYHTLLSTLLKKNYTPDDITTVINSKCRRWKGTEQEQYLRPQTLFGTKFDSYLSEAQNLPIANKGDAVKNIYAELGKISFGGSQETSTTEEQAIQNQ